MTIRVCVVELTIGVCVTELTIIGHGVYACSSGQLKTQSVLALKAESFKDMNA